MSPALSPRIIASANLLFACSIACLTAAASTTGAAAVAAESFTGVSPFGAHAAANRATAAHSGATTRIGRHLRCEYEFWCGVLIYRCPGRNGRKRARDAWAGATSDDVAASAPPEPPRDARPERPPPTVHRPGA